jgi:excisionase family DNA binding protein
MKREKRKPKTKALFPQPAPGQLGLSPREVCAITGIGLTRVRDAIADGSLPARKLGRRHVIMRSDAEAFVRGLPMVVAVDTAMSEA